MDILDFQEYNASILNKKRKFVEVILTYIQNIVNTNFTNVEARLFGSYATNLCLPWSDIDIVLINNNSVSDGNILRKAWAILQKQPWIKSCILIENTTIPLVKAVTTNESYNIQVDLSFQDSKHFGLKCVNLIKSFLNDYEVLQPLMLCLKNLLYISRLNDPYKGGLSSYGLVLLLVSFLQNRIEAKRSITKENSNLGRLLLDFLFYYGNFDHTKFIVYTQTSGEEDKDRSHFQV